MRDFDRNALDRHITSGRYSTEMVDFTCDSCGHNFAGTVETEYGTSTFQPEECPACLSVDLSFEDAGPPERFDTHAERDDYWRE